MTFLRRTTIVATLEEADDLADEANWLARGVGRVEIKSPVDVKLFPPVDLSRENCARLLTLCSFLSFVRLPVEGRA